MFSWSLVVMMREQFAVKFESMEMNRVVFPGTSTPNLIARVVQIKS
jgi:hypothetical protein